MNPIDPIIVHEYVAQRTKQDLDFTMDEIRKGNVLARMFLPEYQVKFNMAMCNLTKARADKANIWFDLQQCIIQNNSPYFHPIPNHVSLCTQ